MTVSRNKLFLSVSLLLLEISLSSCGVYVTPLDRNVQGAFAENVNASLFYQSYAPILLKFRIPDWSVEALKLNKSLKCFPEEYLSGSNDFFCPVGSHLDNILGPLSRTMQFYRNIFNASSGLFYEPNFSCDKIRPHFLHFSAPIGGMVPYMNEYKNRCPLGRHTSLTIKNVASTASQHAIMAYQKFRELHEAKEQKLMASSSSSVPSPYKEPAVDWKALETAGYIAIQNSLLLAQYADSVRWMDSFSSCQSYKLDIGLVSPMMLNDSLTDISKMLEDNGYTFALPFLSTMPHYYKIPLVDCMLTMSNSIYYNGFRIESSNDTANLIVRLLVPVVKTGITFKTYKLNKVPFLRKHNGVDEICEIHNFAAEDTYLLETNNTTGEKTIIGRISQTCFTSKLCKVPDYTHRLPVDPCITGIITNNHHLTSERCHYECTALPNSIVQREKVFPIVTQQLPNKYAITGLSRDTLPELLLECNGNITHVFKPAKPEGTILVQLPCDCELVYGLKRYGAQKPCDEIFKVEHVLEFPVHNTNGTESEERVDYVVEEPKDTKEYNITFSPESASARSILEKNRGTEKSTSEAPGQNHSQHNVNTTSTLCANMKHQALHCGHVLMWIALVFFTVLQAFQFWILYQHGLLKLLSILAFRGTVNSIARLNNEIPVTNLNPNL